VTNYYAINLFFRLFRVRIIRYQNDGGGGGAHAGRQFALFAA